VQDVEDRFGARIADRVTDDIARAFEQLAAMPAIGHQRNELTADDSIRFWSVGPTLIAYHSVGSHIEILFVERGGTDWKRLLARGS
jgi:plasmid stabilization system protein ParE